MVESIESCPPKCLLSSNGPLQEPAGTKASSPMAALAPSEGTGARVNVLCCAVRG